MDIDKTITSSQSSFECSQSSAYSQSIDDPSQSPYYSLQSSDSTYVPSSESSATSDYYSSDYYSSDCSQEDLE